ncbi:hypothetical protein Hanom_Chr01g00043231 [Helianthus anomalus]
MLVMQQLWRSLRFPTGGRKRIYPKISIKPEVKNVYTQKFLYKNYKLSTTERKVWGVGGGGGGGGGTKLRQWLQMDHNIVHTNTSIA